MKVMVCLGIKAQSCFAFKPACNKDEGCIKILLYPPIKKVNMICEWLHIKHVHF